MADREKKRIWKSKGFWILAGILLILVLLTAVYVCARLGVFTPERREPEYIDLVPEGDGGTAGTQPGAVTDPAATGPAETEPEAPAESFIPEPDLTAWDDQQLWSTYTEVEIFRISYENGEEVVTVNSEDGTKVIAPGTGNSYTFRLRNTGNVPLDYTVIVGAKFSDGENEIPVEVRLRDYNGAYLVGGWDQWKPVLYLNGVEDHGILGVDYYAYYTLEWRWPFEAGETGEEIAGNDSYDTYLGNLAAEEDITLTIMIRTVATPNLSEDAVGGLPATGDRADVNLWLVLGGCALAGLMVLILLPLIGKRKRKEEPHGGDEEKNQ